MPSEAAIKTAILARLQARREREFAQRQLLPEDDDFHETVRMKLDGRLSTNQFFNFSKCGHSELFRTCKNCGTVETFDYRCNLKWCPRCQWRITEKRKQLLQLWTRRITQPKHLVLTQRNFPILTRTKIRQFQKCLASLRRRKLCERIRGGCMSIEITNEGNGWHLHAHCLLDVRWLDMERLSRVWGKLVGQEFGIVKIKDVRGKDYVKEVSKYVCEGSEISRWPAEQVLEFVTAIRGRRFFFAFGNLRELAPAIRAELAANAAPQKVCDCGCEEFIYEDETTSVLNELRRQKIR